MDPIRFAPRVTVVNDGNTITFKLGEPGPVTVTINPKWGKDKISSFTLTEERRTHSLEVTADVKAGPYTISAPAGPGGQTGMTGTIRVGGGDDKSQR
ncbi:hypothetical protein [Sorangium sp. So ce388]|uniref:hypothetical protein n=1 Tax=Sorangium sp. So ce388 TaxID=3133309 RepID=UPI003F5B04CB